MQLGRRTAADWAGHNALGDLLYITITLVAQLQLCSWMLGFRCGQRTALSGKIFARQVQDHGRCGG